MTGLPGVDVVVATFRRPDALARLRAALANQTVPPASIQVVDDSATDHGPAWARNQGWRRGRAPVVAFTDDDCVPDPEWVERLAAAFQDPSVVAVEGGLYTRDAAGREVSWDLPAWLRHDRFRTANMAYRREVLQQAGGFDEAYGIHREDTDLAWRVQLAGHAIRFHPEARVFHPSGLGTERVRPENELRLYHVAPQWYGEILARALTTEGLRRGQFQALWRSVTKTRAPGLRRPGFGRRLALLGHALRHALRHRRSWGRRV